VKELKKIVKAYLVSTILFILLTIVLCGVFIAEQNTEKMLFG
jgi:hypothetical protein